MQLQNSTHKAVHIHYVNSRVCRPYKLNNWIIMNYWFWIVPNNSSKYLRNLTEQKMIFDYMQNTYMIYV